MLTLANVPLSVVNRALEIYGQPPEATPAEAWTALAHAEGRIDLRMADIDGNRIIPFAQAIAEYISLSGPWDQEGDFAAADHVGLRIDR